MNYKIITDGSCDISKEEFLKNDIDVVPFYITFDKENFLKEGVDITTEESYEKMVNDPQLFPKTSLPSVDDYYQFFIKYAKEGIDVLCICISSKFSGSYNSAINAKNICLEEYPNAKIIVIDSIVNTCLQGLIVLETCRMRDNGLTIEETAEQLEIIKKTGRIYFMVGNMEYLRKGGRIGKLVGLVGSKLHIKPIIVLKDGEIFPSGIALARKKAIQKVYDMVTKHFKDINPADYRFVTGCGANVDEHDEFNKTIQGIVGTTDIQKRIVGITVGVHTGPYPLGVGFVKKYDCNN